MKCGKELAVRPGTTPTITFSLPFSVDLVDEAWFTLSQRGEELFTKTLSEMEEKDDHTLAVKFTQAETLMMTPDQDVKIQVRLKTKANDAYASDVKTVEVKEILKSGVI